MIRLRPRFCGISCEDGNQSSGPKNVSFWTSLTITCQRLRFEMSYVRTDRRMDEAI
jgi:hypothetical protein